MQKNILWVLQSFYALIYVLDLSPEKEELMTVSTLRDENYCKFE